MTAAVRSLRLLIPTAIAALGLSACASQGIDVDGDTQVAQGAQLFSDRCAGCHTITAAGAEGSGNRKLRIQGPNFNQREVSYEDALYAIRNGGFGGALMPQNIVVGDEAEAVARFVAEFSGTEVESSGIPGE